MAHSITAEGFDASEDGTGRGTPEVGARTGKSTDDIRAGSGIGEDGDPMYTIQSGKQHAIAFSSKDSGADASDDISPTIRAMEFDKSHLNGGGQVAVAFNETGQGWWNEDETAQTIRKGNKQGNGGARESTLVTDSIRSHPGPGSNSVGAIAFEPRFARNGRGAPTGDVFPPFKAESRKGDGQAHIANQMAVRRISPREVEACFGLAEDYTLIPFNGKMLSDSARYRMCGNTIAVPVLRWIGSRIKFVDGIPL